MPHLSRPADHQRSLRIRTLLVDDNETFFRITDDFLQWHDESVDAGAVGAEEALAQAQDLEPGAVVVGLDGLRSKVICRLRNAMPGVGARAQTVLEDRARWQAALVAGVDGVVHKAELVAELLQAIRRVEETRITNRAVAKSAICLLCKAAMRGGEGIGIRVDFGVREDTADYRGAGRAEAHSGGGETQGTRFRIEGLRRGATFPAKLLHVLLA